MDYPKDDQLWQQVLAGDRQAFSELFLKYRPVLLHYGIKLCHNEAQAEECVQDLFCYLFENKNKLTQIRQIKPYLFVAFRRRMLHQQKTNRLLPTDNLHADTAIQFSQEDLIIDDETHSVAQKRLWQMLNELPVRQREVVYLKYYQGLDTEEIAASMDISHQGVLNALYKAFIKLRKASKNSYKSSFYYFLFF